MKLLRDIILIIVVLLLTSVDNKVAAFSSFSFQQVTLQTDTAKKNAPKSNLKKSDLDQKLEYKAADSIRIDRKNSIMYLYGKARVIYDDFELDAEFIKFDQKNNTIFASGIKNDKGKYVGRPIFKSGEQGSAVADSLAFNTVTKKAIISNIFKEQEGGYFSGGKAKVQPDREIHSLGQTYSTCNLPEPHYGLHFTKAIVTDKQIITGPVYMEFEKIPLPLALPFAFFPKPNKKSSGIILPTFYEDGVKGFALTNGGYYLSLNDYWDTRFTGDIYTNGSYHINSATNYTKRYKYNGSFSLAYASDRQGLEGTPQYNPQTNFHIDWMHQQNANARPGTTFSASVNAGTGNFFTTAAGNNGVYDINAIAQNTLSSSISYGRVFGDGLFNLTSALKHSQETQTKRITLSLPEVNLSMSTISPLASKTNLGTPKWYEKITVGYTLQARNMVDTYENLLFDKGGLNRFTNGMQHSIPISLPFNLFQYLNFNASANYNEFWYLQTTEKKYVQRAEGEVIVIDTLNGFKRAGEYNLSMGMSTKIYGKKEFKKLGNIMAIRHVMTPNISFNYKPDFSTKSYYRDQVIYTDDIRPGKSVPIEVKKDKNGKPLRYSIFDNATYGGPSAGRSASVGFSLDNNVELKVRDTKDTAGKGEKKIPIIQGLTISSSYNFVSDSLKLAPINFGGRSQFTDKLGFNFSGVFSPYAVQSVATTYTTGTTTNTIYDYREVDRYLWQDGKLPRLTSFNFSFDYSLNPEALKAKNKNMDALNNQANQGGRTAEQAQALAAISRDPNAFVDFNIPWNFAFSYVFSYSNPLGIASPNNISNTLNFNGDVNLTEKWKVQFTSGYDFKAKNLSYTSFSIYRDLHCWDLSASWIPFGTYQSYSIDIKVKASILQDLKLSKRKSYYTRY